MPGGHEGCTLWFNEVQWACHRSRLTRYFTITLIQMCLGGFEMPSIANGRDKAVPGRTGNSFSVLFEGPSHVDLARQRAAYNGNIGPITKTKRDASQQ